MQSEVPKVRLVEWAPAVWSDRRSAGDMETCGARVLSTSCAMDVAVRLESQKMEQMRTAVVHLEDVNNCEWMNAGTESRVPVVA